MSVNSDPNSNKIEDLDDSTSSIAESVASQDTNSESIKEIDTVIKTKNLENSKNFQDKSKGIFQDILNASKSSFIVFLVVLIMTNSHFTFLLESIPFIGNFIKDKDSIQSNVIIALLIAIVFFIIQISLKYI